MTREDLLNQLESYESQGINDMETKRDFIDLINNSTDATDRKNLPGHITSSAFVLDSTFKKILMIHHKKLNRWLQPGGHIDNDRNLEEAAMREVSEETGINSIRPVFNGIFDLDIHPIPAKDSQPAHYHYDARFLFVAEAGMTIKHDPGETLGAEWFSLVKIIEEDFDESFKRVVRKISSIKLENRSKIKMK